MSLYTPLPADAWAIARDAIQGVWDDVCVVADLRWLAQAYAVAKEKPPPIRSLAERWSWSRWKVAAMIAAVDSWAAPTIDGGANASAMAACYAKRAPIGPARMRATGQTPDRTGQNPDTADEQTPNIEPIPDATGQTPDRTGHYARDQFIEIKREVELPLRSDTLPPEAIRWLSLIERWSNGEAPKNRRWKVDAKADLDWFLLQCLPKAPPGVDVLAELARVDNWLEGQARTPGGGKFWKNIGGVKNGLNRWLSTAKPTKPVQVQASGENSIDPEALWDSLPRLMLAYGVDFIKHADGPPERLRAAVEALGGPRALCAMADRERSFHRKQFVAVYRGAH